MRKVSKKKKVLVRVTGVVGTFLIFMNVNAMPMATVSGDVVNVRTGASMDAEVVAQVQKGQQFEVAGMQDGWYEIKSQEIENLIAEEEDAKRAAQLSADPLTACSDHIHVLCLQRLFRITAFGSERWRRPEFAVGPDDREPDH